MEDESNPAISRRNFLTSAAGIAGTIGGYLALSSPVSEIIPKALQKRNQIRIRV